MRTDTLPIGKLVERRPFAHLSWSTGFADLHRDIGGFRRGQVWVITGEPGVGKTMLLCQWAYKLAVDHAFTTVLYGSWVDGLDAYRRWLLGLVPGLRVGVEPIEDDPRLRDLLRSDLTVSDESYELGPWRDAGVKRRAILIDDPESKADPVLNSHARQAISSAANHGAIVIVTSPLRHCFETPVGGTRRRLRHEWSDTASHIVELEPTASPREVDLTVWRNRHGPRTSVALRRQFDDYFTSEPSHPL